MVHQKGRGGQEDLGVEAAEGEDDLSLALRLSEAEESARQANENALNNLMVIGPMPKESMQPIILKMQLGHLRANKIP